MGITPKTLLLLIPTVVFAAISRRAPGLKRYAEFGYVM
ncbi:hypothetical protein I542_3517 [Mycobacteroides abscessus 1948]|uniref:Uncharacterized protein n=1 Tax=Mycobacteroides abscessus 1948 TaxID=1299323 RepID=A0A829QL90_9MYCO|nr:hypothetical protein I542_3517 [Mycobacteroides abscessus 1948]